MANEFKKVEGRIQVERGQRLPLSRKCLEGLAAGCILSVDLSAAGLHRWPLLMGFTEHY